MSRHCVIVPVSRHTGKIPCCFTFKRPGDNPGDFIRLHQFKTQFTEFIEPFQPEGFLMAGNLQHAVCRRIDNGPAGAHMLLAQFPDDLRAAGQLFPQHAWKVSFPYKRVHQLLRETVRLVREVAPFKIHRHTGNLPVTAESVLPLAHFFRTCIGSLYPAAIQYYIL